MRKNRMMRMASALLILTMLTTCAISGTFAKYVTSDSATDTARVAKWGVKVTATGDKAFFAKMYGAGDVATTDATTATVDSDTKVVAPGTTGTLGSITVEGKPEVDVTVEQVATLVLTGWEVSGAYYCPLTITVDGANFFGMDYASANEFVEAVEAKLDLASTTVQANTDLSATYNHSVSWKWEYTADGVKQTDEKDTALGSLDTLPTIQFTYTTTVTQVD